MESKEILEEQDPFQKIIRLSSVIATGINGMEMGLWANAQNNLLDYFCILHVWLIGTAINLSEPDALICIQMARYKYFTQMFGNSKTPRVLEA